MKSAIRIVAVALSFASFNTYAAMWQLIDSQFQSGKWYCTYQLQGSNPPIRTTIESATYCQSFIFQN